MTTLARRERHALCDLVLLLGESAPTLCGEWAAKDLVAHLLVRENSAVGVVGIFVPPLSRLTDAAMARASRRDFSVMVSKLRDPGLTVYRLRPVEVLGNTLEYYVHHEDLRRAQPEWEPRTLSAGDERMIWQAIKVIGLALARPAGVPLRIRRSEVGSAATLRRGSDPVTVTGRPSELALFLYGREQVRDLEFDGPTGKVSKLRGADLGL